MPATKLVTWEGLIAERLAEECGVPRLELFVDTASTQDVAHDLAEHGAPAGTVVLADVQRSGRGRMGRTWQSTAGRGVWCTIVERPARPDALDVLSLRVGLCCAEALDQFAGERVGVKWPNDLVIMSEAKDLVRRKLGGILVEARWAGASLAWVAIGIGVNVRTPDVDGAAGLREGISRLPVLIAIVRAVRAAAAGVGPFTPDEMRRFQERDVLAGRRIVSPADGTVRGISAAGSLVVHTSRGVEEVRSGTIQLVE